MAKEVEGNLEGTTSFAQLVDNALRKTRIKVKQLNPSA